MPIVPPRPAASTLFASSNGGSNGGGSTVAVNGVTLDANTLTLTVGGTQQLAATIAPTNATNKSMTWSSSDPSVASVNGNGLVTAVSAGSATITVKTNYGGYTSTCAVTVNNLNAQTPNITGQPADGSYTVGDPAAALTVAASVSDGGTLSYQWYSNNVTATAAAPSLAALPRIPTRRLSAQRERLIITSPLSTPTQA